MKNEYNILNSGNKNELVKRRIMQKLNDRTNTLELLTSFFGKEVKYPVYLRNSLNKDIINTLLKLLNDSINTPKYNDILSYLYQFKYNILFLNDFALEDMLDNNFVINNSLYWESNLTLKLYDLNDYILDSFRMELSFNILSESVDGLGKMSRKKLKDKTNYAKSIIDQLLIRTSLLFLPEKEMLEVKKVIEKSIKTGELLNGEADAEKMILECFELYKQDIELPMVISLNLGV